MSKITVKDRINALQQQQRPSTSLGVVDAQRRISNGSKNVKERANYFQPAQGSHSPPSTSDLDTLSSTSNSSSLSLFTSPNNDNQDLVTPPSTNPPSSPRLLNVQTPSSSVRVENGSVGSSSVVTDTAPPSLTPTPSSPAFTATTDVNYEVPELVETDLEHNQEIIQLLRNDKQLSYEEGDREVSDRDGDRDTQNHSPPLEVLEATQDLANLSTSFSATPPAPTRNTIYDDIDDDNDSGNEGGWATVITT